MLVEVGPERGDGVITGLGLAGGLLRFRQVAIRIDGVDEVVSDGREALTGGLLEASALVRPDAAVDAGPELAEEILRLATVRGPVGDLGDDVVALAELLSHDAQDVLGVAVVLGEDEGLRDVLQPTVLIDVSVGKHRRQVVAHRPHDRADLVLGDHALVELLGVVAEVLVDLLQPLARVSRSRKVVV